MVMESCCLGERLVKFPLNFRRIQPMVHRDIRGEETMNHELCRNPRSQLWLAF